MKLFSAILAVVILNACGGPKDPSELFEIQLQGKRDTFQQGETVGVALKNKEAGFVGGTRYSIDGETLEAANGKITLKARQLGTKKLVVQWEMDGKTLEISKTIKLLAENAPEVYTYEIINAFPHDPLAYTQGLEFHDNVLYESTGKKGQSTLRKVDFSTGEVLQKVDLDNTVFGEGLTILHDNIYQLTWQSGIGYIYDLKSLENKQTFTYGKSREGWGLCNNGEKIYKSDGTEKIWFLDPDTLVETGYIEIVTNRSIFNKANELEYVAGKLYANVYGKESMMIIDAQSGAIEGVVNFGGLKKKIVKGEAWDEQNSVLNGVAYHPERETFFVTGKNWDKLFEVKLLKK